MTEKSCLGDISGASADNTVVFDRPVACLPTSDLDFEPESDRFFHVSCNWASAARRLVDFEEGAR